MRTTVAQGLRRRHLVMEGLEQRRLLAVDLLSELNLSSQGLPTPRDFVEYNGQVIFRVNDGTLGPEPWITDGTPENTELLRDIHFGAIGSGPRDFAHYNGQLFFSANNQFNGYELWVTEGTQGTTRLIADIWPGTESGIPTDLVVFQDKLYFFANDGESGRELYRTDGTAIGTERVADSIEGRAGSSGEDMMVVGDKLFFLSDSGIPGKSGLWTSDGTEEGTQPLPIPGVVEGDIGNLTPFGDRLLFVSGGNLWISDGSLAGSQQVVPTGDPLGEQISSVAVNRGLVYVTDEGGLHEIDPELGQSKLLTPLADGVTASHGAVYYWSVLGVHLLDGQSTITLVPFNPGFGSEMGKTFNVPGGMLFHFKRALDRHEIWVTNGTIEGTELVEKVTDRAAEPLLGFQQLGDGIYFAATNGALRESLWRVDAPTIDVVDPGVPGDFNGDLAVNAADIDALHAALVVASSDPFYDLDGDGSVTQADVSFLVREILKTREGDLNLDGIVDFDDFLELAARFGSTDAGWEQGDLDGDRAVTFDDFLALAANFGFDSGDES